jgi:hypothetical protein
MSLLDWAGFTLFLLPELYNESSQAVHIPRLAHRNTSLVPDTFDVFFDHRERKYFVSTNRLLLGIFQHWIKIE